MTARPEQPEPFVRGCVFAASGTVPYPRLRQGDADQLPGDVWTAATLPVGVRLEFVGDASALRIRYRTTSADLGYRGDGAGCMFTAFRSGRKIAEEPAVLGEDEITLALPGDPEQAAVVYLPEGMRPVVLQVQPVDGGLRAAPRQPRCVVYGDAVTQGWLASSPATSWPSVLGRKLGLDVVNLGCAGTTRLEPVVAQMVATTPAEVVVVSVGGGCWSRPPHSLGMLAEEVAAFVQLVRAGHPGVPLVVVSPLIRPAAEDTPNVFGATLAALRRCVEETVGALAVGDPSLVAIDGAAVLGADDLEDGIYPGDEGHKRLAAALAKVLGPRAEQVRQAAIARWQEEVMAQTPAFAGLLAPPPVVGPLSAGRSARIDHVGRGELPSDSAPSIPSAGAPGQSLNRENPENREKSAADGMQASQGGGAVPEPAVPAAVAAAARASAAAAAAYAALHSPVGVATGPPSD